MVGISRTRTRQVPIEGAGSVYDDFTKKTSPTLITPTRWITTDVVGNPEGQNPFSVDKRILIRPCRLTGQNSRFIANDATGGFESGHLSLSNHLSVPSSAFRDATQAIAQTHPGEPLMSLPNFAYELRDIPGMLRHAWDRAYALGLRADKPTTREVLKFLSSPKARAEDWLNYQFGWRPFINDLFAIQGLSKHLSRRVRQIIKARKDGFIRTRVGLGDYTASDTPYPSYPNWSAAGHYTVITKTTTAERWAVARWTVTDLPRFAKVLSGDVMDGLHDVLGMDFAITTVWDALPYTWLVDWFSNVGSLLTLKQNRQGIAFKSAVIMTRTVTRTRSDPKPHSWLTADGPGIAEYVTKSRALFSPTFVRTDLGLNYLSDSQLTTLASLQVARRR